MESRDVAAARHLDDQRIVAPDPGIIARERLPHAAGFDPHDRVGLGIKIRTAAKRFHGDGIGFEPVAVTGEGRFHNE
ncbi:MAG: hypothetical protein ACLPXW_03075 [Xanthobacteraceae bacterium]